MTLDGFKIKCRPSSGQGNSILKTVMGDSSHIVTGLIPDEDYTVSVQPFHRERDGTESSLEAVRTLPEGHLAPPPSIPNSLLESKLNLCGLAVTGAYPVSATKLQLTWSVSFLQKNLNNFLMFGNFPSFFVKDEMELMIIKIDNFLMKFLCM